MEYNKIQDKYIENGVPDYQFKNIIQVGKIVGTDPTKAKYWDLLSPAEKALVDRFIVRYLNGMGLEAREGYKVTKVYNCTHHRKTSVRENGELVSTGYVFINNTVDTIEDAQNWEKEQEEKFVDSYWEIVKVNNSSNFLRVNLQKGEISKSKSVASLTLEDWYNIFEKEWFHVFQNNQGEVEFY